MAYDLFIKRRIDEVEEKLLGHDDAVERMHLWFSFVRGFSMETHTLMDTQYNELVNLCKIYTDTPDPIARKAIRKQINACARELENLHAQLKRIPKLQSRLEQDITQLEEPQRGKED